SDISTYGSGGGNVFTTPAVPPVSVTTQTGATTPAGKAATTAASGSHMTRLNAMVHAADAIASANLPYAWGGGHPQVGVPSLNEPGGPSVPTPKPATATGTTSEPAATQKLLPLSCSP